MSWPLIIAIFFGGGLGALSRFFLQTWIDEKAATGLIFPLGVLAANVIGCLLFGLLTPMLESIASEEQRLLWRGALLTGFLGSLTTFSTFAFIELTLIRDQAWGAAIGYLSCSFLLGLGAVALGFQLGQMIAGSR